jgi:hypothetical protein
MARFQLVDVSAIRWCHGMTRCVRRAFLLGEGEGASDRKRGLEKCLKEPMRRAGGPAGEVTLGGIGNADLGVFSHFFNVNLTHRKTPSARHMHAQTAERMQTVTSRGKGNQAVDLSLNRAAGSWQ